MGVPKFFRWISARYPCINEVIRGDEVPEIDHLYLDMNGILHTCSHPDDGASFMSEEIIFKNIKSYILFLIQLIKPQKTLFLAVDGVAPRAKMTQQRARRFQSAQEARSVKTKAEKSGKPLEGTLFDPCVISPGTEFMERLQNVLKKFVQEQVTNNERWRYIDVILSGHDCPGEGEHKVREYMSYQRGLKDYQPNERHCIYGMDADLVFLGLSTHETNICILRENIVKARTCIADQMPFCMTYLSVLREYINNEFEPLKNSLKFDYDLERIVDDWIFMAFLLGNDFIPHIPNLHIHADSFPVLWDTYHVVLPRLDGYLIEFGRLNVGRFHEYLSELSKFERSWLEERESDHRWMQGRRGERMSTELERLGQSDTKWTPKRGNKRNNKSRNSTPKGPSSPKQDGEAIVDEATKLLVNNAVSHLPANATVNSPSSMYPPVAAEMQEEDLMEEDDLIYYEGYRRDYYWSKLEIQLDADDASREQLNRILEDYIRMLQWVLCYYFLRVADWNFYYPHHYAPFLFDLKLYTQRKAKDNHCANPQAQATTGMDDLAWTQFEMESEPVLPFVQQLMILPADSAYIVPKPYRQLLTSATSPLAPFVPDSFSTDINGKIASWEAVVLIPFLDERILFQAMAPLNQSLSAHERARNSHKSHLVYRSSCVSPTAIDYSFYMRRAVCGADQMRKQYHAAVNREPSEDFPSLARLPYSSEMRRVGVHVFESPSKGESLALIIHRPLRSTHGIADLARQILGKPICVRWPHCAIVMPVRVMTKRELWELGDFNVAPVNPSNQLANLETHCRPLTINSMGSGTRAEFQWFQMQLAELERHLRQRQAIIISSPALSSEIDATDEDDSTGILIFSRPLKGWSIRRLNRNRHSVNASDTTISSRRLSLPQSQSSSSSDGTQTPQFTLIPQFATSHARVGHELKLTDPITAHWSNNQRPSYGRAASKREGDRAIVPSMRTEPAHGLVDGLHVDLLDLHVPGLVRSQTNRLGDHRTKWDETQPVPLTSVFRQGQVVFVQSVPHIGRVGEVASVNAKNGTVAVRLYEHTGETIDLAPLRQSLKNDIFSAYLTNAELARYIGLHPAVVARFTGTIPLTIQTGQQTDHPYDQEGPMSPGRYRNSRGRRMETAQVWHVGLKLKRNKTHAQVLGWSRFCPTRSTWVYSSSTAQLLRDYFEQFPEVWDFVMREGDGNMPLVTTLPKEELDAAVEFLTDSKCWEASVQPASGRYLDAEMIRQVREPLGPPHVPIKVPSSPALDRDRHSRLDTISCDPEYLYMPITASRSLHPTGQSFDTLKSTSTFDLLDRVVFCAPGQTIPLGSYGTVVGTSITDGTSQSVEVVFDKEFTGGVDIRGSGPCGAVVQCTTLLKLPDSGPESSMGRPHRKIYLGSAEASAEKILHLPRCPSPSKWLGFEPSNQSAKPPTPEMKGRQRQRKSSDNIKSSQRVNSDGTNSSNARTIAKQFNSNKRISSPPKDIELVDLDKLLSNSCTIQEPVTITSGNPIVATIPPIGPCPSGDSSKSAARSETRKQPNSMSDVANTPPPYPPPPPSSWSNQWNSQPPVPDRTTHSRTFTNTNRPIHSAPSSQFSRFNTPGLRRHRSERSPRPPPLMTQTNFLTEQFDAQQFVLNTANNYLLNLAVNSGDFPGQFDQPSLYGTSYMADRGFSNTRRRSYHHPQRQRISGVGDYTSYIPPSSAPPVEQVAPSVINKTKPPFVPPQVVRRQKQQLNQQQH